MRVRSLMQRQLVSGVECGHIVLLLFKKAIHESALPKEFQSVFKSQININYVLIYNRML